MSRNASVWLRLLVMRLDSIRASSLLLGSLIMLLSVAAAPAQYLGPDREVDQTNFSWSFHRPGGHLRVIGLSVAYLDAKDPKDNLNVSCSDFAARSKVFWGSGGFELKLENKRYIDFFPPDTAWLECKKANSGSKKDCNLREELLADCDAAAREEPLRLAKEKEQEVKEAQEARERAAREAEEARERSEREAREASEWALREAEAARARETQEAAVAAKFKDDILAAWHAAESQDPFAGIRGDFDLSGSDSHLWTSKLQLAGSQKCGLIKTPAKTPKSAFAWTFACNFRATGAGYEQMVKTVQTILGLQLQPDESSDKINQVFFVDSSKPARRLFVAKIDEATIGVSVVAVRFTGVAPGRLVTDSFPAVATILPQPKLPETAAKVETASTANAAPAPFPKQPELDRAQCAAYLQRESERTSKELEVHRLEMELNNLQLQYQTVSQKAMQAEQAANSASGTGVLGAISQGLASTNKILAQKFQADAQNLQLQVNQKQSELNNAQFSLSSLPALTQPVGCSTYSISQANVPSSSAPSVETSVHDEVEKIRGGTYSPLPPAQISASGTRVWGGTTMTVKNSTGYELTVFYDGPVSKKLTLAPGTSQEVELAPGAFHVAGRVTAGDVLPFYGEESYASSAGYSETFYIAP